MGRKHSSWAGFRQCCQARGVRHDFLRHPELHQLLRLRSTRSTKICHLVRILPLLLAKPPIAPRLQRSQDQRKELTAPQTQSSGGSDGSLREVVTLPQADAMCLMAYGVTHQLRDTEEHGTS